MEFPSTLKRIRKEAHLSQDAFAKLLGVSRATINRWEQGIQEPSKLAMKTLNEYFLSQGIVISEFGETK